MEKMDSSYADRGLVPCHRTGRSILAVIFLAVGLLGCTPEKTAQVREQSETASEGRQETAREDRQGIAQGAARPSADGSGGESGAVSDAAGPQEKGGTTPQEVVLSYLAGLQDQDLERMEAAFLEEGDLGGIIRQYAILCGIDQIPELASGRPVSIKESKEAEHLFMQLEQRVQDTDLGSIQYRGLLPIEKYLDPSRLETYQKLCAAAAQSDGGDRLESQVALIGVNGDEYALFFDTIEIEGRWYIRQLGGTLPHMMDLDTELAGTLRLDAEDKELLGQLVDGTPDTLPAPWPPISAPQIQGEGYGTPQQAAAAYLEGLKAHDMDQMLQAFAVEAYAENYDLQAAMEDLGGYLYMQQDVSFPPADDFATALIRRNRSEQLKEDSLQQGRALYLCSQYLDDAQADPESWELDWEELPQKIGLDTLQILGYIPPEALYEDEDKEQAYGRMNAQKARRYGAEQIQPCVLLYDLGGKQYALFMETARYDDSWYAIQFGNVFSLQLGLAADFMGTAPAEVLEELVEIEDVLMPVG